MIHVHIESKSVADLQSELSALLGGLSKGTIHDLVEAVPQADVTVSQDAQMGIALDKVKAEELADDKPADEEPTTDEPADEPQPTMEEARAALNEYRKKKGLPALKALFAAHGVKNFLDLPAAEYAAIMKEAEQDAAE